MSPTGFPGDFRIGRGDTCDLVLASSEVSSLHLLVRRLPDGALVIEDAGSTNGTTLNGHRLRHPVRVNPGDPVALGRVPLDWKAPALQKWLNAPPPGPAPPPQHFEGPTEFTLGRDSNCDETLASPHISRRHARLWRDGQGQWWVEDLGSSNGVFVHGRRIQRIGLQPGAQLTLGPVPIAWEALIAGRPSVPAGADPAPASSFIETAFSLQAHNITVQIGSDGPTILRNISIALAPGELVGLIGPSGSGKTTLLDTLQGKHTPTTGWARINGHRVKEFTRLFLGSIGVVPQDDIIHRDLTVGESLRYSAQLRFPSDADSAQIHGAVDRVLNELGIAHTRKTRIGDAQRKGISGGQRKRVNLAQELLTEPGLLFLDEPTSGLDPRSDEEVMDLLRGLTARQRTILITTHAVTPATFARLHLVVILAKGGRLAYFGPAHEATAYFGVREPGEIFKALESREPEAWEAHYRSTPQYQRYVEGRLRRPTDPLQTPTSGQGAPAASSGRFARHLRLLTARVSLIKCKDTWQTAILLLQAPIIAALLAMVFMDSGGPGSYMKPMLFVAFASIWFGASNASRELVVERPIFEREHMAGVSMGAYLASKLAVFAGLGAIQCALLLAILELAIDFQASFGAIFMTTWLTTTAASTLGLVISSSVRTTETAMAVVPVALLPQILLSGGIQSVKDMPGVVDWLSRAMLARWSLEALLGIEDVARGVAAQGVCAGLGMEAERWGLDLLLLTLMGAIAIGIIWKQFTRRYGS